MYVITENTACVYELNAKLFLYSWANKGGITKQNMDAMSLLMVS